MLRRLIPPLSLPVVLALSLLYAPAPFAQSRHFPVPPGLEGAVEFWKQIFTRYSFAEVVLFDPLDPGTIYGVVRAPDNEEGRALVEKERARIVADYDLADEDSRIRSQRGAKEHFAEGLRISGRYIAEMKKIFRDEGLPEELTYLPLVESSFNIHARSGVGAVGMWQFMPDTGKKFLRIDGTVDERRDPVASTHAAARLLKQNFRLFENWPLAITAYNHGTEGIFRGMKAVESDELVDLIRRYQSPTFGFASKNFYAEFLAVREIATKRDVYFPFLRAQRPVLLREVEVRRPASLPALLKPAAISQNEFFDWNPALDRDTKTIPVGYRVKLPAHKIEAFVAAQRRAAAAVNRKAIQRVKASTANAPTHRRPGNAKAAKRSVTRATAKTSAPRNSRPAKMPATGARAPVKTPS
jgi:membrane-bound lytic murein transglycosylase D